MKEKITMHIIIDIRSRHPEDNIMIRYAENWVKKWRDRNPHDIFTFLIFHDQEAPEWENFFRVRPASWLSWKKRIQSTNKNEIFRCVNFSQYPPYDSNIPTITHIFDMAKWFYDSETNANILRRKEREYEIKKIIQNSSHIIVPNFFTGNELVELWNANESNIDIFPILEFEPIEADERIFQQSRFWENFFLHDATYGSESNIIALLEEFQKYKNNNGKYHLALHGNTGKNLTSITEAIRVLQLEQYITITGSLNKNEQEALYNKAKAWIFIGPYNTSKTNISLAHGKKIPLILSDIPAFTLYKSAIKIHPNHLENLSTLLLQVETNSDFILEEELCIDENIIFAEYKNILSKNNKL